MDNILKSYKPGDELEIKFYIDPRLRKTNYLYYDGFKSHFYRIIKNLGIPAVTYNVDITESGHRKRIQFTDSAKEEFCIRKEKIGYLSDVTEFGGYKVTLDREIENSVISHMIPNIRIKLTISYIFDDWRLDISYVKNSTLNTVKKDKLVCLEKVDTYPSLIDGILNKFNLFDHLEFEAEYIGSKIPTSSDVDPLRWYKILFPDFNFDHKNQMAMIAKSIKNPMVGLFQSYSKRVGFSHLFPKAKEIALEEWMLKYKNQIKNMIVREKIDGIRCAISIVDDEVMILTPQDYKLIKINKSVKKPYLMDCEYEASTNTYYILHLLIYGSCIIDMTDSQRLDVLDVNFKELEVIEEIRFDICPYMILSECNDIKDEVHKFMDVVVPYKRDGILISTNNGYWQQDVIKAKELSHSSLDLLVVECPVSIQGKAPYIKVGENDKVYILFHGISNMNASRYNKTKFREWSLIFGQFHFRDYFPIQLEVQELSSPINYVFSSPLDLNNKICEFNIGARGLEFLKIRTDRTSILCGGDYMGNDYSVIIDIYRKHKNPFSILDLFKSENVVLDMIPTDLIIKAAEPHVQHNSTVLSNINIRLPKVHPKEIILVGVQSLELKNIELKDLKEKNLPPSFIGGAKILISKIADVPILKGFVAPGGTMIVVSQDLEVQYPGFNDLNTIEEDEWYIHVYRRESGGFGQMSDTDMLRENPHLNGWSSKYEFKYSRQKTKDIPTLTVMPAIPDPNCIVVNPKRCLMIWCIEALLTCDDKQVLLLLRDAYCGERLKDMFPTVKFLPADYDSKNVEVLISDLDYQFTSNLVKEIKPDQYYIKFEIQGMSLSPIKSFKAKMLFTAFAPQNDNSIVLYGLGKNTDEWNLIPFIFNKEMQYFNYVYRTSCFKYSGKPNGCDSCYDCRTMTYILGNYVRYFNRLKKKGVAIKSDYGTLVDVINTIS